MKLRFAISFGYLILFCGCGTMFDITGKGSLDTSMYYNVETQELISNHKSPINSIYFWIHPKENSRAFRAEETDLDPPVYKLKIIVPPDSLLVNNYSLSIHLDGDHWRMMRHIDLNKDNLIKKKRIYARFTSH